MNSRSKYKTKQREILLDYFETVPGIHVTAGSVCEYLKAHGAPVGKATVYRQLENMVDEGLLKKYIIDGNSPACFEYVKPDCSERKIHFHCKCEKCGKLIHLDCDEMVKMQEHLMAEHHFKMDPVRTVFYGVCEQCM